MGAPKPGLLIPVDGMPKLVSVDGLESMQALVGGDMECVGDAFGPNVDAWVNAESLILGMPPNLAHPLDTAANEGPCTEVLCGPVLVLGINDDGETVGLTADQTAAALKQIPALREEAHRRWMRAMVAAGKLKVI